MPSRECVRPENDSDLREDAEDGHGVETTEMSDHVKMRNPLKVNGHGKRPAAEGRGAEGRGAKGVGGGGLGAAGTDV